MTLIRRPVQQTGCRIIADENNTTDRSQKKFMDIVTHFALGICTTEIARIKSRGKGILFLGGLVQCLPDIDTVAGIFLPADRSLMIHRGITHSFFFAVIGGLALSLILYPLFKRKDLPFFSVFLLVLFQLTLHDLLDVCNAYGTGLLEPFSHERFSANLLFVADPLFSLGLIVAAIVLLVGHSANSYRLKWARAALLFSCCYVAYAGINKAIIDHRVSIMLQSRRIGFNDYFTTPAPLNSMLWYVAISSDSCYYTAYSSVFDSRARAIELETHPKNYAWLEFVPGKPSVQNFRDFAAGYYTISGSYRDPYFNVLRFGQIQGWEEKNAPFVLSYPLAGNGTQAISLQKGRLTGWNADAIRNYLRRIAGN
ncbi:MAG: metal-dependent hydrolase [Bacteroidetes bacterium]|nr:metal-dependent hydrolase [Bacteroidota bacterium]